MFCFIGGYLDWSLCRHVLFSSSDYVFGTKFKCGKCQFEQLAITLCHQHLYSGLSKPKMPVAKFEQPVAKYFYRLPPGGVLMVRILSTRGHLVRSLHTRGS